MDFPPNSEASKQTPPPEEKKVERVTSAEAIRRKKPLGKQFREMFFSGTAKEAVRYMTFDVLIPAAKDMIAEAGAQGIERLIFGDSRRRRGSTTPQSGPTGYVQYNRYAMGQPSPVSQRTISRRARAIHDFDEIVLQDRIEAEEVIDRLYEVVNRYESASVADLYELVGIRASHTDNTWGWTDLRGSGVAKVRDGYLLVLPEPVPLRLQ